MNPKNFDLQQKLIAWRSGASKVVMDGKRHPKLLILVIFFLLVAWIVGGKRGPEEDDTKTTAAASIDTYIPNGFVLVPIQIQNLASLDSLVGQYAVVDLYAEGETVALGRGIKLVRSPRDPSQFAVLVPENVSHQIVAKSTNPLQVIVQNPRQAQSQFRQNQKSSRITWEDEK